MDPNVIVAVKLDEIEERLRQLTAATLLNAWTSQGPYPKGDYAEFYKLYSQIDHDLKGGA